VQTAQSTSLRLLQWMMAASLALPMALFGVAAVITWNSTRDDADRQIQRSLDVAHEHALKVFETIDRSLSEINEMVRGLSDDEIRARAASLHERLRNLAFALPQLKSAWIFDSGGQVLVNSLVFPAPGDIDFSDRDYFKAQLNPRNGIFIGQTLLPRAPYGGAPFFSVSRRREHDDHSFAGVIQASVLSNYFENYYARLGHDPGSFFALGLTDGTVLARFPSIGQPQHLDRRGAIGQQLAAQPQTGLLTMTSPIDGIERRLGYQRLAEYPVYVSAGMETAAIRARFLATIGQHLVFGIPATALLFLILALALRRTQNLHAEAARRRQAEEALKHGQRLEALGQLTGGVAHDFNNLLTVIRASVDLLQRPDLSEERRRRYIDAISDTVGRATRLTAQLLAFARRQPLKPEHFDVGRGITALGDMVRAVIGSAIEMVFQVPDEPCFVSADVGQFETALINLVVNARDAMMGEGRLTLSVRPADKLPGPGPHPERPEGFVAVAVSDSGAGIPPQHLGHIFEPFYTTKQIGKGTGLGLSQVFGFVKQSGGEVDVATELGKGSTFTLYLPRVSAPLSAPPQAAAEAPPLDGDGRTVLVVEDNRDVGTFAIEALTELGYAPTLVGSAGEALAELSRHPEGFDVVFSDIMMPGLSGIELAREIDQRELDLPVLLTSGFSQTLSQHGRFGYELLQKPYSIDQLAQALGRVVRQRRVKRGAAE